MRHFITYLLSTIALATLMSSCERETKVIYEIDIDPNKICTAAEQDITIDYLLHDIILKSDACANISADADWVTIVDTSTLGKFTIKVDKNEGDNRSTQISISVKGCKTAHMTLMQYGTPPEVANHTLMYLFMGTSLERYFNTNIADTKLAIETGILGNSNRVIFFRQESSSKGYIAELCYDIIAKKCIEQRIEDISLPSGIITPEIVGEYISKMAEYAPAKRYGLVCAGHGQAWITRDILTSEKDISTFGMGYNPWIQAAGAETTRAYGEDNVRLNITELAEAIESSDVELDYILFDACFMSNIETIYDLRNMANYIIASPCEIMGRGFPYEMTLPYLFTDFGNATDYEGAAYSYYHYYHNETGARSGSIAVYDCAEIEGLAEATREVMRSAKQDGEYNKSQLQTYEGQRVHHFYDFGQWVNVVANDEEALKAFNEQLNRCIIHKYTLTTFYSAYGSYGTYPINVDVYSGVTTSAPSEAYPNGWRETNWYKEVIKLEN